MKNLINYVKKEWCAICIVLIGIISISVKGYNTEVELKEAQENMKVYEAKIEELQAEVEDLNELIETITETNDQLEADLANANEIKSAYMNNALYRDNIIDALEAQVKELKYDKEVKQDILHSDYKFNQNDLDEVFEYYESCICNENLTVNEVQKLEFLYHKYYDSCIDCLERGNDKLALAIAYEFMKCAIDNLENCTLGDDHSGMFEEYSAYEFIRVLETATR